MITVKRHRDKNGFESLRISWNKRGTSLPLFKDKVYDGSVSFKGMTIDEVREFGKALSNVK